MPKLTLTKNKKIVIGLVSVFLVLGFVFVINAPEARAWGVSDYLLDGLAWICYLILTVFSKLVTLAAYLLKSVFEIEKIASFTNAPIVTVGWGITRGLCNMIFALILLLMAFDTILQTNKFPVKTILPKLVIVALLINFSLIFCGIIIDFSQILTHYFIDAAGGPSGDIGVQLANGLNMAKIFKTPADSDQLTKALQGSSSSFLSIISSLIFGIIIILIAAFALGAGAIFMLIRLISIWVLLIFAPLAWVFAIAPLPGLSSMVGDWWTKFFKWTFFGPIYAFFIYLAVVASSAATTFSRSGSGNLNDQKVIGELFTNGFLAGDGIVTIMQYIVIVMLLLLGLKTAQESGLQGAGAVMAWGKKAGDKLKGYAKRPGQFAYDQYSGKVVQGIGSAISGIPLLGKTGNRIKARGVAMETGGESREQHKAYTNNLKTMSDMDLQEEVKHAWGIRKLLAARQAKERGLLDKTKDADAVRKAMDIFGAYGVKDDKKRTKEQRDLEDVRFDVLDKDEAYQKEVILRAKENGNLEKIKPIMMQNNQALNAVADVLKHEFDDVYKKWSKGTKDEVKNTLLKNFTDDISRPNELERRKTYASITGEITTAFGKTEIDPTSGKTVSTGEIIDEDLVKNYVQGMTAGKVAEIRHQNKQADLQLVGKHASAKLAADVGRERGASSEQKTAFSDGVMTGTDDDAKEVIRESPGWGATTAKKPAGFNR